MMALRAEKSGLRFRPHFKTHQSLEIGAWFREFGVSGITVSSVTMARYFAEAGWKDITIAFPFNIREIPELNRLDPLAEIHLLADHPKTVAALAAGLTKPHRVFIKIDTGYHRCGIPWDRTAEIIALARQIESAPPLSFAGILTHAGHSYHCEGPEAVKGIFRETIRRMTRVGACLRDGGISAFIISVGNTPGCSLMDNFGKTDEIRPGNFVFYDLMQLFLGSCREENLALALLCPVVGIYPERNELVIQGGTVHFSKESLTGPDSREIFGYGIEIGPDGFGGLNRGVRLVSLSQEHGILRVPAKMAATITIGTRIAIVPVHACLTADLYGGYIGVTGEKIPRLNSVSARSYPFF